MAHTPLTKVGWRGGCGICFSAPLDGPPAFRWRATSRPSKAEPVNVTIRSGGAISSAPTKLIATFTGFGGIVHDQRFVGRISALFMGLDRKSARP